MNHNDYINHDMLGLAALVAAGETTPGELLDIALSRTAKTNEAINAINFLAEEHGRRAIEAGLPDGPFKGVPSSWDW